jgi:hypothetical protein
MGGNVKYSIFDKQFGRTAIKVDAYEKYKWRSRAQLTSRRHGKRRHPMLISVSLGEMLF